MNKNRSIFEHRPFSFLRPDCNSNRDLQMKEKLDRQVREELLEEMVYEYREFLKKKLGL